MKIYDCFTIFNELDLLEARLEYLYSHIDYFVIVESTKTHNEEEKPLHFDLNKEKFSKYMNKIIHIKDYNAPKLNGETWKIENYHRNCIAQGIVNADKDDIILISDLDEIPNIQNFPFIKSESFKNKHAMAFTQLHYNYFVNIYSHLNPCVGTVAVKRYLLDSVNPQHFRNIKDNLQRLNFGGWHLSYLGGIERIWNKFMTSCDVANKSEIPSPEIIKQNLRKRLKEGQFNIRHDVDHPVSFVENPYLPTSITKEKYPQFFLDNLDSI